MDSAVTLVSTQVPGWFGKLPGSGDFAARRLPESARLQLDGWLQAGLQRLRERHSDWTARYLESPLWCFLLGENIVGPARWLGVLMPSVDAVGRYFPLIVAAPCNPADGPLPSAWFSCVSRAALDGLERDLDAARFDTALAACFQQGIAATERAQLGDNPSWPAPSQSLWLTEPGGTSGWQMRCAGLPLGERFDALFGFLDGAWVDHLGAAT